jgi:hypothetical protein
MEESSSDSWQGKRCFSSQPDWPCGPPTLLIQLIPESLSTVLQQLGHEAHSQVVPGLRISRAIPLSSYMPSCCVMLSHPFWFWSPSNILSCGLQGLFPQGYTGQRMKPATYFHLVLRLRLGGAISLHALGHKHGQFYLYIC